MSSGRRELAVVEAEIIDDEPGEEPRRALLRRVPWRGIGAFAAGAIFVAALNLAVAWLGPRDVPETEVCVELDRQVGEETGISNTVGVQLSGEECWASSLSGLQAGDEFTALMNFQNLSGQQADEVILRVFLSPGLEMVPYSARWHTARTPEGVAIEGVALAESGVNVGSYTSGSNAYVTFDVRVVAFGDSTLVCGPPVEMVWTHVDTSVGESPWATAPVLSLPPCDFMQSPVPSMEPSTSN